MIFYLLYFIASLYVCSCADYTYCQSASSSGCTQPTFPVHCDTGDYDPTHSIVGTAFFSCKVCSTGFIPIYDASRQYTFCTASVNNMDSSYGPLMVFDSQSSTYKCFVGKKAGSSSTAKEFITLQPCSDIVLDDHSLYQQTEGTESLMTKDSYLVTFEKFVNYKKNARLMLTAKSAIQQQLDYNDPQNHHVDMNNYYFNIVNDALIWTADPKSCAIINPTSASSDVALNMQLSTSSTTPASCASVLIGKIGQ